MKEKILIVEDDRYLADDIQTILELFDYQTQVVNDVDDILKVGDMNNLKLILLDIMMRTDGEIEMNGFKESGEAVYSYIRKKYKNIPIVIMSAMDKEDININFNDNHTKYIKKPFSGIEQLMELIN